MSAPAAAQSPARVAAGPPGAHSGARWRAPSLAVAAVVAGASFLPFLMALFAVAVLRSGGYSLGYRPEAKLAVAVVGLVAVLGLVAALIIALMASRRRATSLRTRAFFVIAVAVLIPSFCLAAFGVWAYYRSWETAGSLYTSQAQYRAQELSAEIASLSNTPIHLTAAQRARLSRAIVHQFSVQGHSAGALLGDLSAVTGAHNGVLPGWAVRSLQKQGYAIGGPGGPTSPDAAQIVVWRTGTNRVYYYTDYWGDLQSFSPYAPLTRLLRIGLLGLALIVVLGLLGAWVLSRSVVRPVRRLAEASGRLAEGETGVCVRPKGPREMRELAASFNDMNAKLFKAQETEQAFLLSVSHELKTPLTSIRGYAEGIGDGTVTPDDGAEVIGAESSRLERLVGDLLDSARMRKSAFTVRRETVDLAALTQDVALRYKGTAQDAGLTLHVKTDAGGSAIADNDRVLQVVSNLVENAIRCTPPPGTVTITTAPGTVAVSDTGRGLTSDDLPRAFERFYLYSRYGIDRPVGTGLGLAIVKELTEAMGGTVSVSSAVGVGTAFTVVLPRVAASPLAAPSSTVAPSTVATPQDVSSSTAALPRDDAS
jgi:signal transduction histidine kinase